MLFSFSFFYKKVLTSVKKYLIINFAFRKCSLSSVGQSNRLITGGSKVRILEGAPIFIYIWIGGRVAKGGRL